MRKHQPRRKVNYSFGLSHSLDTKSCLSKLNYNMGKVPSCVMQKGEDLGSLYNYPFLETEKQLMLDQSFRDQYLNCAAHALKQNNIDLVSSFSGLEAKHILIAEDYHLNVHVLTRFLKKWQIDYTVTANGGEALEKYSSDQFDLVLMDLQMPVMDGYTATKKNKKL